MAPTIQSLEASGTPFVVFKFPHQDTIQGYYQMDNTSYSGTLNKIKGYVFAPFISENKVLYIPDRHAIKLNPLPVFPGSESSVKLPTLGKAQMIEKVLRAKNIIAEGAFKKLVLSHCFTLSYSADTTRIFTRLTHQYPNAYVYYWFHPKTGAWMGATPERLLVYDGKHIHTTALAGTLPAEMPDSAWTTKEFYEQQLVTDSIISALQKTVAAEKISQSKRTIIQAGDLKHLQTNIRVKTHGMDLQNVVNALHPTPAVGGIPTRSSVDYIKHNEGFDRTFYTGFMGPVNGNESAQLFVNLRCAHLTDKQITLYAGAGITAESRPEKEWEEICRKAQTFLNIL